MSSKTASVTLDGDGLRFFGVAGSGHHVILDDLAGDTGMRPAELVPLALAGCTAMDVISILRKKRQQVTHYEVRARGTQADDAPHGFTRIDVVHDLDGVELDVAAVRRAIELSATRYCPVNAILSRGVRVEHRYRLVRDPMDDEPVSALVVVTGPS